MSWSAALSTPPGATDTSSRRRMRAECATSSSRWPACLGPICTASRVLKVTGPVRVTDSSKVVDGSALRDPAQGHSNNLTTSAVRLTNGTSRTGSAARTG